MARTGVATDADETMPLPRSVRQPFAGAFSKYEIQHLRSFREGPPTS